MDYTKTVEDIKRSLGENDPTIVEGLAKQATLADKSQSQNENEFEEVECSKDKDVDEFNSVKWMLSDLERYLEVAIEFNQKLPSIESFLEKPGKDPGFCSRLPKDIQTFKSNFNSYHSKLTHAINLLRRIVDPTLNAADVSISKEDFLFLCQIKHVCNELFGLRDSIMYNYIDLKRDRDSFLWT